MPDKFYRIDPWSQNTSPQWPVVSIGHSGAFYVAFVPLEYIPCKPPHSTYVIVICTFREWVTIDLQLDGETM